MKKLLIILVLFEITSLCRAQYPALLIADSLKKNADGVIRFEETVFEIKTPGKAKEHRHSVYTILNNEADYMGFVAGVYGKLYDLNYIDAKLFDAFGKEVKKIKTKDMADESGSDGETLMTDLRYKVYNFGYKNYPYTVEVEKDEERNGILSIPHWNPQSNSGISVELSRFIVIAPKEYVLRYKAFNYPSEPIITEQSDKKIYTWEIKNLPAKTSELAAPEWQELVPYVMIAPSQFEAQGYSGDMSTWQGYGKFIYDLLKGRDILPDDIKRKVHEITDGLKSPREKVYALYELMQQNTRYISIQFGIGGIQPFDANFVATKKYGDCKALSNFMVALLKEAGIKGNSVVIKSGKNADALEESFPSDQFDHVIACVPLQKDTIWLECTNQTLPAGYLGSFTGNRKALLIDENGSYVVNTKRYTSDENKTISIVKGEIDSLGKLTAKISTKYSGYEYFSIHQRAANQSKEEQLKDLKEEINLPTYDVTAFNYDDHKSESPYIDEHINVVADACATVSGKRLFFTPNFLNQNGTRLKAAESRKFDVVYKNDFAYIDTLQYKIPQGYVVEAAAKDVVINNKFGIYEIHFKVAENNIVVIRTYERKSARYPPSEYNNLVKFYDDMYKADRSKIVFVKKDS